MSSEFGTWYTAQFGSRPSRKSVVRLEDEALRLERQLLNAQAVLRTTEEWEIRRSACLTAWTAGRGSYQEEVPDGKT